MRRLFPLLLLLVPLIAGCGRSDPAAEAQAEAARAAAEQQRLEEETERLVDAAGGIEDLKEELAADEPAEEPAPAAGGGDANRFRTWTDPAGNTLAVAEFVSLMGGNVCLEKEDGGAAVIPLDELSRADREFVEKLGVEDLAAEPAEKEAENEAEEATAAAPDVVVEETAAQETAAEEAEAPEPAPEQEVARAEPAAAAYEASRRRKVVVPFDFQSQFDDGRYGRMVADSIWKKLDREDRFLIPGSMLDVRDLCAANSRKLTPQTPLEEVAEVVRGDFDADVGIWGSVERAPGAEWEIYDLAIKCVDFSGQEPKVIYEVSARTKSVSEIPHLYVKEMIDELCGREPGGPPPVDQFAEENWKNNPNLVAGGDFQKGAGGVPVGWAKGWEGGFVGQYEPLGNVVKWIAESGNSSNRVIRFTMDKALADSTGVPYYSDPFPVEEGAKYRFQCRWRSNGPTVKVFIKCYTEMGSEYRPEAAQSARSGRAYVPESSQLRECYRSQQNLSGPKNTWNTQTEDFTPKHTKYTPRWGRVMLYAYHPAGVVEFDDVVLKQIVPPSPGETRKDRRHSMESDVTIRQMEDNERRGAEARGRLREREKSEP